jgi:hypothetical protein
MGTLTRVGFLCLVALAYMGSFFLPAYGDFESSGSGWEAFQLSWYVMCKPSAGSLMWWAFVAAWLVNPTIWAACVAALLGWPRATRLLAIAGLVLALPVLALCHIFLALYPAYWLWAGSAGLLLVGTRHGWVFGPAPCHSERPVIA